MENVVNEEVEFSQIPESTNHTAGIEICSSFMSVAVKMGEDVKVLENEEGRKVTPCALSFFGNEIFVGEAALSLAKKNPNNTILDVPRYLGCSYDDLEISDSIANSKVKIVNKDGVIVFEVETEDGKRKLLNTWEAMSILISNIRNLVRTYVDKEVNRTVISVPVFFSEVRRKAIGNAAKLAGFTDVKLITHAEAIYRNLNKKPTSGENILFFSLLFSSVEVVIMNYNGTEFILRGSSHDESTGGKDLDKALKNYLIKRFNENNGINIPNNHEDFNKLDDVIETLKHKLTKFKKEEIYIENLSNGCDLNFIMTRIRFDSVCSEILSSVFEHVEIALSRAELNPADVHRVYLSGGSANFSQLKEMLAEHFKGVTVNDDNKMEVHESVVRGCALTQMEHPDAEAESDEGLQLPFHQTVEAVPFRLKTLELLLVESSELLTMFRAKDKPDLDEFRYSFKLERRILT